MKKKRLVQHHYNNGSVIIKYVKKRYLHRKNQNLILWICRLKIKF